MPKTPLYNNKDEQIVKLKNIILSNVKEYQDISEELHESLAQLLAAARLHIEMARHNSIDKKIDYLKEADNLIFDTIVEVKALANRISPMTLKNLGFVYLIHELMDFAKEQREIECIVSIDESCIQSSTLHFQNILYQVALLQIINILKCKHISKVLLSIKPINNKIRMIIRDDGLSKKDGIHLKSPAFQILINSIEAFDGSFHTNLHNKSPGMNLEVRI